MSGHLALVGDSVFDNRAYTKGAPDVAAHLRDLLPSWSVTLRAVDGSATVDLPRQLDGLSQDVTHLIVSIGGNDALRNADILDVPVPSTARALDLFRARIEVFERDYGAAVEAALALRRPTTLCTIYKGNLGGEWAGRARLALMLFNDVIVQTAVRLGLNAIDLRSVCTEPRDFANAIEPSGSGGRKIAEAIARAVGATDEPARGSVLLTG